jgi:succinate dehydrogenase / fumarate reductase, cytochrome b subunit
MWALRLYRSTIGKKAIMAVTGVLLIAFLVEHMMGNLLVFVAPARINSYSAFLHSLPEVLWAARIILLVALVLHVMMAYQLTMLKRQARPIGYQDREPQVSTVASRTMRWGGVLILVFIIFHLLHFTTGTIFPIASRPDALYPAFNPADVYGNIIAAFRTPWVVTFYVVVMLFLMLHIFHGAWASIRTLGWIKPSPHPRQRPVATLIALIVWLGFTAVPVAVFLGVIR